MDSRGAIYKLWIIDTENKRQLSNLHSFVKIPRPTLPQTGVGDGTKLKKSASSIQIQHDIGTVDKIRGKQEEWYHECDGVWYEVGNTHFGF